MPEVRKTVESWVPHQRHLLMLYMYVVFVPVQKEKYAIHYCILLYWETPSPALSLLVDNMEEGISTRAYNPCVIEKDLSWVTVQCSISANCHLWISRGTFRCHSTYYLIVKIIILLYLIISIVWWVTFDHLLLLVYCIYICCSSTW